MSKKVIIAIDAMGGEKSPKKIIDGINMYLNKNNDTYFHLFGNAEEIKREIGSNQSIISKSEIINCAESIKDDESPLAAAKRGKGTSMWKTIDLPGTNRSKLTGNYSIIGEVVGIHINDEYIENGMFNTKKARPVARLGYMDYGVVGQENIFSKNRPKVNSEGQLEQVDKWDGVYR